MVDNKKGGVITTSDVIKGPVSFLLQQITSQTTISIALLSLNVYTRIYQLIIVHVHVHVDSYRAVQLSFMYKAPYGLKVLYID